MLIKEKMYCVIRYEHYGIIKMTRFLSKKEAEKFYNTRYGEMELAQIKRIAFKGE